MSDEPTVSPLVASAATTPQPPVLTRSGAAATGAAAPPPVAMPKAQRRLRASHLSRDQLRQRSLALADAVAIFVSLLLALAVMPSLPFPRALAWGAVTLPAWVVLFKTYGLYERDGKRISHTTVDDIPQLFHVIVIGTLLMWLFFAAGPVGKLEFVGVLVFGLAALIAVIAGRVVVRGAMRRSLPPERVLILGQGQLSQMLIRKMRAHPEYALEPVGIVDGSLADVVAATDVKRLAERYKLDRIILADPRPDTDELLNLLTACRQLLLKVSVVPNVFEAMGPAIAVDDLEGVTVLGLNPPVMSRSSRAIKRTIDILGSGGLLLFTSPLLILIAVAIKIDSRGPALFRQRRVGKGGRIFRIVKFRTMVLNAERLRDQLIAQSVDPHWIKLDRDPRVTRLGQFLRKTSLDELPQLWNVLRGEMSLVGPRPLPESEDILIEGWGRGRLDLTPGITGYWQVLGRTNIPFTEMVKLDYVYVTNWSLWTDIRLILRTFPAVLLGRGVN